jgi:amidase
MKKSPGKLHIAFSTRSMIDSEVHPECVKAVEDTAKLLEKLGHRIDQDQPKIDGRAVAISYLMMYMGEVAADIEKTKALTGKKPERKDFETATWTLGLLGRTYSAGDFVREMRVWNNVARAFGSFFEKYDLYLTPVTSFPAHKIGELQPKPAEKVLMKAMNTLGLGGLLKTSGIVEQIAIDSISKVPFTQLANLSGLPAMSVPLHWTADNLPCGSHFMARFGDEATLFRLAAQLEEAKPWFNKRSPVSP